MTSNRTVIHYDPGFPVVLPPTGVLAQGRPMRVVAELTGPATAEVIETLAAAITPFVVLSGTFCLGGDRVPPWESVIEDFSGPHASASAVEWTLERCHLDDRSVVVLVNLLARSAVANLVRGLRIIEAGPSSGPGTHLLVQPDFEHPYPVRWPSQRFPIHVDKTAEGEGRTLTVTFQQPPEDVFVEQVQMELLEWAAVAMQGAYAPARPERGALSFIPDMEFAWSDHEVQWSLDKFRAHADAADGLVNLCLAIDRQYVPIQEVRFE